MPRKAWTATDAEGNIVQAAEVTWPEEGDQPDLDELQANIEERGLTFTLLADDADLPQPLLPEPPPPSAEENAARGLVAKAKATLKNDQAPEDDRQRAAIFLQSMGEL